MQKRKLGRGLQALLGGNDEPAEAIGSADVMASELGTITVAQIDRNPYQPRREFPADELKSLADSIAVHGVIQPIVVRHVGERYQLIAGERRLRAAEMLGLQSIPARILELTEQQVFEIALVENLQRQDLNAIEKAAAFADYVERYQATHEQLAQQLGIDRSTITNFIRLLELPESVREAVRHGQISYGHARAMLAIDDKARQVELCREIINAGLSVRQVEQLVRDQKPAKEEAPKRAEPTKSNHLLSLESDLRQRFGTKVLIKQTGKEKGNVVIPFTSNDDFERIMSLLGR